MVKRFLKKLIYNSDNLYRIYSWLSYKYDYPSVGHFLHTFSKSKQKVTFVQIGANDGESNDNLYNFIRRDNWKGVLIEPQKDVFDRLQKAYRMKKNLTFENFAISDKCEKRVLYKIAFSKERWATGLASFYRENVLKEAESEYVKSMASNQGIPYPNNSKDLIEEEIIECTTLEDVIIRNHMECLNLLAMDTEGFDFEIIKSIDLNSIKPEVLFFEHRHLSSDDHAECISLLKSHAYNIASFRWDSIAFKDSETLNRYIELVV